MKKNPRREPDDLDRRIMQELVHNSKRSYRRLARDIGMSPAAVIERIRNLEKGGHITGYGARLGYQNLGFEFMAVVEVSMSGKDIMAVERKIAGLPHVSALWDTTGEYDAIAVVMCKSRDELSGTIKKILGTPGVAKTNTNIVLNVVKRLTEFDEV